MSPSSGRAFQLTNFIRDVREDFELDRVYLPGDERARLGVSVDDIAERRMTDGLRTLLAAEVARARHMFATTEILDAVLDPAVRPGVRIARSVYGRILDRVEALGFDVLGHRIRVPPWQLGGVVIAALSTPRWPGSDRRRARARTDDRGGCQRRAGGRMTVRATARGAERSSLDGTKADVLICGASFAGLAVARELAGCGASVLLVDRYRAR